MECTGLFRKKEKIKRKVSKKYTAIHRYTVITQTKKNVSKMDEMTLEQALEKVEARFIYNLPESEFSHIERLFFQIEQAHWFYEVYFLFLDYM